MNAEHSPVKLSDDNFNNPIKKWLTSIVVIVGLITFSFAFGYRMGNGSFNFWNVALDKDKFEHKLNDQGDDVDLSLMWKTLNLIEQRYVDKSKIDRKDMYYGMIKGMVASVDDPYTFFLTPKENIQFKEDLNGKFEGIGAQLDIRDGLIHIVAPLPNSPAEKAGIKPGDIIIKVDGNDITGMNLQQVVLKIKGPSGTVVRLGVVRNGEEISFEIVRSEIIIDSVELKLDAKSKNCKNDCPVFAYLKVNKFADTTQAEWDRAVEAVAKAWNAKKIKGLVLDLRNNPGGYLTGATYLSSEFLKYGDMILKQEYKVVESKIHRADRNGRLKEIPVVVLVNRGSASASEIVAGALRDNDRAVLVGEKTFGKGSVQEVIDLNGGSGLHITIAKWILPDGDWINEKGIIPEFTVKDINDDKQDLDEQLEKALEILLE